MAYSAIAISSLGDVPTQVRAFAETQGWSGTDASATRSTIRHPTYTGALEFSIEAFLTGTDVTREETLELKTDLAGGSSGWVYSPKLNPSQADSDSAVEVKQPTKLHLFGNQAGDASDPGDSWIAAVIEYGFNLYRHLYLGYPARHSAYTGGEIVSGSWQYAFAYSSNSADNRDFDHYVSGFPFSAMGYGAPGGNHLGGMHIAHAGNAEPWRTFNLSEDTFGNGYDDATQDWGHKCIIGGYRDSINSGYVNAGKSPFTSAQVLSPVNLYIGKRSQDQQYWQAVGRPRGVRMVHMEDLEPGAAVTVGSVTWRVFPVFSRRADFRFPYMDFADNAREYPPWNTSYYVGMAYRET